MAEAAEIKHKEESQESLKRKVAEVHLPKGLDKHQIASGAIDANACFRSRTQRRIPKVIKKEDGRKICCFF